MRPESRKALARYVAHGNRRIQGWLARTDAEIFRTILLGQVDNSLPGSAVEIGVHHGRSFIALCLGLQDKERAYCIDIFDSQHLNKDSSGKGNQELFTANLASFLIDDKTFVVDRRSSQEVDPKDIVDSVGPARFFSIDGGHWFEIVQNDLRLAESALAEHGVIALDDFYRAEWPNVTAGYFAWHSSRKKAIVPFAIGFNKLYLCEEKWSQFYKRLLAEEPFLARYLTKQVEFQGVTIPVYQAYIRAEMDIRARLVGYLKTFNPSLYFGLSRFRQSLKRYGRGVR